MLISSSGSSCHKDLTASHLAHWKSLAQNQLAKIYSCHRAWASSMLSWDCRNSPSDVKIPVQSTPTCSGLA